MPGSFLELHFSKGTNSHFQTAYLPAKLYVQLIFPQLHEQQNTSFHSEVAYFLLLFLQADDRNINSFNESADSLGYDSNSDQVHLEMERVTEIEYITILHIDRV